MGAASVAAIALSQPGRLGLRATGRPLLLTYRAYTLFLLIVLLFDATSLPLRLGFNIPSGPLWTAYDYAIWGIFLVHFLLWTLVPAEAVLSLEPDEPLSWRRLRMFIVHAPPLESERLSVNVERLFRDSSPFFLDGHWYLLLIGSLPYVFAVDMGGASPWLLLIRLLQVAGIPRTFQVFNILIISVSRSIRVSLIVLLFLYIGHVLACLNYVAAMSPALSTPALANRWYQIPSFSDKTKASQYLVALLLSLQKLVGYMSTSPSTDEQFLVDILFVFVGAGVFAVLVALATEILQTSDLLGSYFRRRVEAALSISKFRNLPDGLTARLKQYYMYQWATRSIEHTSLDALQDAPRSLQTEILMHQSLSLIEKVPFFRNAPSILLERILRQLRKVIYLEISYIVKARTPGREMYFLHKGSVDVLSSDEHVTFATLPAGSFFGEMSIIFSQKRQASIKAREICEVYVRSKRDFDIVMSDFPEERNVIVQMADQRARSMKK